MAEAKNSATQLGERVIVRDMEHVYWQPKYDAVDQLSVWVIMDNPKCLSLWYDPTRCDLLWPPLQVFISFCDYTKGAGGLVSERDAKLGSLKSDLGGEWAAKLGRIKSEL